MRAKYVEADSMCEGTVQGVGTSSRCEWREFVERVSFEVYIYYM